MSGPRPGILLVGNYPPPFGGVPKHLETLVPHLVQRGWDVHLLSGGAGRIERGNGFTVYRDARPMLPRRLATAAFLLRVAGSGRRDAALASFRRLSPRVWAAMMTRVSLAAQILEANDIRVIGAYNLLSGAPVGAIAAEMYRVPLVVTNLGEIFSHRAEVERQLPMIRHVIEVATVLTSLTHHCASSYRVLGLSPEVRVLPYGIERERFEQATSADVVRRRLDIPPDADVVLFLGRLTHDMGVSVLLDALPPLLAGRESVWVLIAGAAGELMPRVEAAAARWPGRVRCAVDVPEAELPQLYAAATVVVAPTLGARACGSLAATEAMAAGKPVVASRIGGIPEIVSDGETGLLVPPSDAGALAAAVLRLLADRDCLREFGRRGRARAAELFDGERTNDALERMFREAAGLV